MSAHPDDWSEPLSVVDEEGEAEPGAAPAPDSARPYACPGCEKTYTSQGGLRAHLISHPSHGQMPSFRKERKEQKGKSGDASPRRGRVAGAAAGSRQERRRKAVRETIEELTDLTIEVRRGSGQEPDNLADVLRRDADKIATSLSWIAERVNPLGRFIDLAMGHGGAFTIARGFNGVGIWFLRTWRQALARRAEADAAAHEQAFYLGDEHDDAPQPGAVDGDGSEGPLA